MSNGTGVPESVPSGGIVGVIREKLFCLRDPGYRRMQIRILPTVRPESVIGVRTPHLRRLAGEMAAAGDIGDFLKNLPHAYFEENQLHAFILSGIGDFAACLEALNRFLPFVDNWATCDQMSPRVFRKHRPELLESVKAWMASEETFTVRFGLDMLMAHYLDEDFDPSYPEAAAAVRADEYYVSTMVAWYFATALAKRYDAALPFIVNRRLDRATHNRAIRKALESRRIPPERKEYLKTLRITD